MRAAEQQSPRAFTLPVVTLAQLQAPDAKVRLMMQDAIFKTGMFTVVDETEASAASEPFGGALHAWAECEQSGNLPRELVHEAEMDDGTRRITLATATNATLVYPLEGSIVHECPAFASAANELRARVDATGAAYAAVLDQLVSTGRPSEYTDAVTRGESLEHFHVFRREHAPTAAETLRLHSDVGLFIVMTAAEYYETAAAEGRLQRLAGDTKPATGFLLELADGELVRPIIPDNSLLVMNGEGSSRWISGAAGAPRPRAASHEVHVPDVPGATRAWFGRMYFPPRDALLQDSGEGQAMTFNEYREQTYRAMQAGDNRLASTVGCDLVGRSILADSGSCASDEVYCWMQCMKIPGGQGAFCGKEDLVCVDPNGRLWPEAFTNPSTGELDHCFDCTVVCPGAPPPYDSGGFCNTNLQPTTMWMTGFQTIGKHSQPCVIYLFHSWVLDSAGKFMVACIGTVLMGVAVSALASGRARVTATKVSSKVRWHRPAKLAAVVAMFFTQILFAYALMLVAMSFQFELFLMVVIGLTIGHAVFHIHTFQENVDACCEC
ncbi:hypothetical protein FOA52_016077 [Chlamydomonas sp. UWO 241]|nr:hypothetical protein FOA52_016077 [Chlamydomonas sp. UWO 241]